MSTFQIASPFSVPDLLGDPGTLEAGGQRRAAVSREMAVIIATRGRPEIARSLVEQLRDQTRPPKHVIVVGSSAEDVEGIRSVDPKGVRLSTVVGRKGLTLQRNDGLRIAGSDCSYVCFFDDDFVPSRFWLERARDIFESRADVAGLTGVVLADGTGNAGIPLDTAKQLVSRRDADSAPKGSIRDRFAHGSNVGCNMAYRWSSIQGIAFDERLPLYAWLEDSDFRGQVERRGAFVSADDLWGVHLGHKHGRVSGVRLGYSQIANGVYLARKGTVSALYLYRVALRNVLANALRSIKPERFVDRRGRLLGNLIALMDFVMRRLSPERILDL